MGLVHASANTSYERKESMNCKACPKNVDRKPGNPGSLDEIHKQVKDLYPRNFEGAKLAIKKKLSDNFNVTHTITLSSVTPSGYKFGANYIGTKRIGSHERYPIAIGDITPNGNLNANFVHTLGCRFRFKLAAQVAGNKYKACSSCLEYRSDDFTLGLTLGNPRITKQHGTLVLHFLQSITSRIALGAEIACLKGSKVPGGWQTLMCGAIRYNTGPSTFSATLGEAGLHACYYHRASSQLQIGVELEVNVRTHEAIGAVVYQLDVPHADLTFRGIVNSEATVGGVLEKRFYSIPESSLAISGLLNQRNQQFRVGIGLNIGQ